MYPTAASVIPKAFDVIVIGSGVIGASTALSLSRAGYKVCAIDKNRGPGEGTTSYSSGICRSSYSIQDSVNFAWEGYHYWKNWEDFIGVKDSRGYARLRECGAAFLRSPNSSHFLERSVRCMTNAGLALEEWDLDTASERLGRIGWDLTKSYTPRDINDPQFGDPVPGQTIKGAVYCATMGYVSDPLLATQNLAYAAECKGAHFMFQKRIVEIVQSGGKVKGVMISDGTFVEAPIVVNAGGPYSSKINKMAFPDSGGVPNDMRVSTRPMRQEVAYTQAPPGCDYDKDGVFTADLDVGVYMRPEVGNKLLIGGLESPCDPTEWFDGDPAHLNTNLTSAWTNYVWRAALRIPSLPIPSARNMQGIVSLYDVTPDWAPIYDKSAIGGYYLAIGTSGNQFKNAGIAGELVAGIINHCENGNDHDSKPFQFEMKRTGMGRYVNSKSFSRLRTVNDTSNSVMG